MAHRLPQVTLIAFSVAAVFLASVFYLAGTEGDPEGFGAASAVAMPLLGGGVVLAMAIGRRQGWLVVATGFALTLVCLVYWILLPFLALTAFAVARHGGLPVGAEEAAIGVWAAAGILVPSFVLAFRTTPATWETDTGSGAASDIVTTGEATFAVIVVVVVTLTTLVWSRVRA